MKIELNDLKRQGLLGCGGFGAVTLEKHRKTGDVFALKKLSKVPPDWGSNSSLAL